MSKNRNTHSKVNVRTTTVHIAVFGMLTALATAISFLTIRPGENMKLSLTFIPVVIAAYLYGAVGAGAVAGLADIIGCIIKPAGMLYPPITITEIAVGVAFGLLLYRNKSFIRILIAAGISQLLFSMFVTPLWLNLLYGMDYSLLLATRIPQIAVMLAIQLITIPIILTSLDRINIQKLVPPITFKTKGAEPSEHSGKKAAERKTQLKTGE